MTGQIERPCRCILSKFYIKPQLSTIDFEIASVVSYRNSTSNHNQIRRPAFRQSVVSYRNSTSNHNCFADIFRRTIVVSYRNSTSNHNTYDIDLTTKIVVSYRNSTSNHNLKKYKKSRKKVVSYRNSTSNHNLVGKVRIFVVLYLIEILHQTTTVESCVVSV